MNARYQNSNCLNGYLHDYRQVKPFPKGVLERCSRCKDQQFFPYNVANHVYLSYHLRQALQPNDPLFKREYPNFHR